MSLERSHNQLHFIKIYLVYSLIFKARNIKLFKRLPTQTIWVWRHLELSQNVSNFVLTWHDLTLQQETIILCPLLDQLTENAGKHYKKQPASEYLVCKPYLLHCKWISQIEQLTVFTHKNQNVHTSNSLSLTCLLLF